MHLIDTQGQGIEDVSARGIIANGKEYAVDIIIWSTGYGSPVTDSMPGKAQIAVIGKNGLDMDEVFKQGDLATLHGLIGYNYPNLFSLGLSQTGVGVNQTQRLDAQGEHAAYIIKEAEQKSGGAGKTVIEPREEACTQWGDKIASYVYLLASMAGCGPSYFNMEGDQGRAPPEVQAKVFRNTIYGQGLSEWLKIVADWRARGGLEGLEISRA